MKIDFSEENFFFARNWRWLCAKKNLGVLSIVLKYRTLNIKFSIPPKQKTRYTLKISPNPEKTLKLYYYQYIFSIPQLKFFVFVNSLFTKLNRKFHQSLNYIQIADALFQKNLLIKTKKLVFHNPFKTQWYFEQISLLVSCYKKEYITIWSKIR